MGLAIGEARTFATARAAWQFSESVTGFLWTENFGHGPVGAALAFFADTVEIALLAVWFGGCGADAVRTTR
jgi:hypothetical protein